MPNWKKAKNVVLSTPAYIKSSYARKIPVVVIDVRDENRAKKSHIKGAVSIPLNQLTTAKVKFPKQKAAPIVIYADNMQDSKKAFGIVRNWGYKNATVMEGGFNSFVQAKGPTASNTLATKIVYIPKPSPGEISAKKFQYYVAKLPSNVFILDARDADEAAKGMLKGAVNIPTQQVIDRLSEIPKNKQIVVHCKTGVRAEMAYQTLKDNGYNVTFLKAKIQIKQDGRYRIKKS